MKMVQIQDLFEVKGGSYITASQLTELPFTNSIPVVGASGVLEKTVVGYINKDKVSNKIFPQHTIYVSTNGALCCTAFLAPWEFTGNVDMVALIEKQPLTIRQKLYYCLCINTNKHRFSYGRKPKGTRFSSLEIPAPEEIPAWVETIELPQQYTGKAKSDEKVELPPVSEWKEFKYTDLFDLEKGRGPSAADAKHKPGHTPYIGASAENNGITIYSGHTPEHQGNVVTIATDGSVGEAFYQPKDFNATSNIMVLHLKGHEWNPQIGLFISTIIRQEQNKFSYGRKWGLSRMKESFISLPVTSEGQPDYDLMEQYINSLPYSDCL